MREKVPFQFVPRRAWTYLKRRRAFQFFKHLGVNNMIDLVDEDEYEPQPGRNEDPEDDDDPEPLTI